MRTPSKTDQAKVRHLVKLKAGESIEVPGLGLLVAPLQGVYWVGYAAFSWAGKKYPWWITEAVPK